MHTGGEGRLGEEQREHLGKGHARIGHADQGLAAGAVGTVHQDGGSGALFGAGEVTLVLGEGQVARLGAVGRGEALKGQCAVPDHFAPEAFGNVRGGIRHKLLTWTKAATIKGGSS